MAAATAHTRRMAQLLPGLTPPCRMHYRLSACLTFLAYNYTAFHRARVAPLRLNLHKHASPPLHMPHHAPYFWRCLVGDEAYVAGGGDKQAVPHAWPVQHEAGQTKDKRLWEKDKTYVTSICLVGALTPPSSMNTPLGLAAHSCPHTSL